MSLLLLICGSYLILQYSPSLSLNLMAVEYVLGSNNKQKGGYKNTFCKLALGMFILSVGLYAADYFLMKQRLFNSITNTIPQANLMVAAVLTIVIVYALFQLLKPPQEPPLSIINGATNENLMQHHVK